MAQTETSNLDSLLQKLVGDVGAAFSGALVVLGDKLGLYRAMRGSEPLTAEALAEKTGTFPRYVREWLSAQAASGYVTYDAQNDTFSLTPEQELVFADEASPAFFPGAFEVVQTAWLDEPKIEEAFRTGAGVGWHEHSTCLFRGTERFFRPGYNANLVENWIPALEGVTQKLEAGATVADVGCGHGASTIIMAQAFPNSRFFGFDYHEPSIERARMAAEEAGVAERTEFARASAKEFPARGYDLVAMFDCLHDMGDPVGAGRHVREALGDDGVWMIVEPFAHDHLHDNLNPVGRVFYSASTMICTPASASQEGRMCLGAQAGEARMREVAQQSGFTHFRRATETPFNLIYEVKP